MTQFKQEEHELKNAHFFLERERERLASLGGFGEHGVVQSMAKDHPLLALKAWLKRWKLWLCVCMRSSTLEAFP